MDLSNCFGYCKKCNCTHNLPVGNSRKYAKALFDELNTLGYIDDGSNKKLSLDYLWGEARGQMFGVLECQNSKNQTVILKAFSCMFNGVWLVDGWAPPLFDEKVYQETVDLVDGEINALGRAIQNSSCATEQKELKIKRRELSRASMLRLHALYRFHNFSKEVATINEAFSLEKGIPSGCGDCCAPKLLNLAAILDLKPVGISEFYFGKTNLSETRRHGEFYTSCENKCQPILGFLLCGMSQL